MMPGESRPFRRPITAQEAVLAELRTWIVTRRLAPGDPIRQDAIAADLGVSRVPVREALKILEGEGHVAYRPHRGYSVIDLEFSDLVEIYRIRQLLEDEAVRISVPKLGEEEFERMEEAMADMERASRDDDLIYLTAANRRFHFTTFEAASMPRLQHYIRVLWDSSDPYRSMYFIDPEHRATVNQEHRDIMAAVRSRRIDDLLKLLERHRENAVAGLHDVLGPTRQTHGLRGMDGDG